jgi:hypothetical protein
LPPLTLKYHPNALSERCVHKRQTKRHVASFVSARPTIQLAPPASPGGGRLGTWNDHGSLCERLRRTIRYPQPGDYPLVIRAVGVVTHPDS